MVARNALGIFLFLVISSYSAIGVFALSLVPVALIRPSWPTDEMYRVLVNAQALETAGMIGCPALAVVFVGLVRLLGLWQMLRNVRMSSLSPMSNRLIGAVGITVAVAALLCRMTTAHVKYSNGVWKAGVRFGSRVVQRAELPELLWRDILSSATGILFVSFIVCVGLGALWWGVTDGQWTTELRGEDENREGIGTRNNS